MSTYNTQQTAQLNYFKNIDGMYTIIPSLLMSMDIFIDILIQDLKILYILFPKRRKL